MEMETDVSERKAELLAELASLGESLVRGTVVRTLRKCGRPGCECAKGRRHRFCYLSRAMEGRRNKIVYVKPSEEWAFEAGVAAYRRAWAVVEELSSLNIEAIKQRGRHGQG